MQMIGMHVVALKKDSAVIGSVVPPLVMSRGADTTIIIVVTFFHVSIFVGGQHPRNILTVEYFPNYGML